MTEILKLMARHGYAVIFGILFAESVGVPLPAGITLVAAGAAVASHALRGPYAILAALAALAIGNIAQYWLGRRTGWGLLSFLCRLSMNPETCILRSAETFYKRGKATLLFARFVPGLTTIAAPLAGSMNMPFPQFAQYDFAGAVIYTLSYVALGYVSRDFLASIFLGFHTASRAMEMVVVAALVAYGIYRFLQFRKYRTALLVPRVHVEELAQKLSSEDAARILIVDARSHGYYDPGATRIKGSIRIEPNNLDQELKNLPKDKDIYLYCT